jgi:flagellar biosynthesis/type III secretory pathway M-ring protein FliF/YscJ
MDMTGYVSVIGGDAILENITDEEEYEATDASYFFGERADSVHVNPIMYPSAATIKRCGIMHDGATEDLLKMWSRVKGANASAWTYILIFLVFAGLITLVVIKYTRKAYRRRKYVRKRRK